MPNVLAVEFALVTQVNAHVSMDTKAKPARELLAPMIVLVMEHVNISVIWDSQPLGEIIPTDISVLTKRLSLTINGIMQKHVVAYAILFMAMSIVPRKCVLMEQTS